jgi:hypothetical protein
MSAADSFDLFDVLSSGNTDLLSFFYQLLWRKGSSHHRVNAAGSGGGGGGSGPGSARGEREPDGGFHLPDTVILHHSRVLAWYFTSVDGTVKKKSRKSLSTELLLTSMLKKGKSISGCICSLTQPSATAEDGYTQQFATEKTLPALVSEDSTGILQLFIDPKQDRGVHPSTQIIVAQWTPNVFFLERRINSCRLDNEKLPLADRCTTADTSHFVRIAPLVSTRTTKVLEEQCEYIAKHIEAAFHYKVVNLILHFVCDDNNVPWVLRCTSLRIVHPQQIHRTATLTVAAKKLQAVGMSGAGGGAGSPSGSPAHSPVTSPERTSPGRHGDEGGNTSKQRSRNSTFLQRHKSNITRDNSSSLTPKEAELRYRRSTVFAPLRSFSDDGPDEEETDRGPSSRSPLGSPAQQGPLGASPQGNRGRRKTNSTAKPLETMLPPEVHCALCAAVLTSPWSDDENDGDAEDTDLVHDSPYRDPRRTSRSSRTWEGRKVGGGSPAGPSHGAFPFTTVQLRHVLFPLGVLEFYQSHTPDTVYHQRWDPKEDEVPPHVRIIFPEMLTGDYADLKDSEAWLEQLIPLCEPCSCGLLQLTGAIHIRKDGAIQYPFGHGRSAPQFKGIFAVSPTPIPAKGLPKKEGRGRDKHQGHHERAQSTSPERPTGSQTQATSQTPQPQSGTKAQKVDKYAHSPYLSRGALRQRIELPPISPAKAGEPAQGSQAKPQPASKAKA